MTTERSKKETKYNSNVLSNIVVALLGDDEVTPTVQCWHEGYYNETQLPSSWGVAGICVLIT